MIFAQCAVLLHRSSMYNYWNQIPCMLASRIVKALQEKQLFHGGEGHSVKLLSFFSSLLYKFFNFLFQGWAISCWCVLRCQCLHRASHSAWWGRCIPGRKNRQTPQTSTGGKYCKYFSLNADATALRIHTVWKCLNIFFRNCDLLETVTSVFRPSVFESSDTVQVKFENVFNNISFRSL